MLLHAQTAHAAAPPNDDRANATVIPGLPFTDLENTADATTEADDPDCYGNGPTVWYSFTASADATLRVLADTFGSNYDTTLSIYTKGDQIGCNDDAGSSQSGVIFEAAKGVTYDIMVGSYFNGPGGDLQFNIDLAPPPIDIELTVDPTGKVDLATGQATLSGTVLCSYPTWVNLYGFLKEKLNHLFISGDFGEISVYCTGETAWTSPAISADNGLFKGGKASVDVTAYASNVFDFDEDNVAQTIKLGGGSSKCIKKPLPAPEGGTAVFCSVARTFLDAEADCVAKGGHLLSIHDPGTQTFVVTTALGIQYADWWIGLDDRAEEGVYTWTDGSPLDFSQWAVDQPDNAGDNEDCVHLAPWASGDWNDEPCDEQQPYICRLP
jgi:hypothetical protein